MTDNIDAKAPGSLTEGREPEAGTQNARLLDHLRQSGATVDPMQAWRILGIYRLSARVFDLRNMGHRITASRKTVLNRFSEEISVACYRLERDGQ